VKATVTVLGSGTSMGVPTIGCDCAVCTSPDPRDRRTRPSILVEYGGHSVLIDTGPDFREQALREKIHHVDAVLYTHAHADHILGLDDLRPLSFRHSDRIPLYADEGTAAVIETMFRYTFDDEITYATKAQVTMNRLNGPLNLFGAVFERIPVMHGAIEISGFRFGNAAYLTDMSSIPESSMARLSGLDILFLDALRRRPHPTHSNLENSVELAKTLAPARTLFTHISHDLGHEETNNMLPANMQLCYDGQKLEFEI